MEFDLMRKFGMTTTEIKVYLELSKIGESTIGPLIKRTKMHRGSVYNAIQSLTKKGFVSFVDKEGRRYYNLSGKNIFIDAIDDKKRDIEKEKKELDNFFEMLSKKQEQKSEQEVNVFYGVDAFKTLFFDIYDECKKNNCEYLFLGKGGEMAEATGMDFYKYTQKLKKKKKIKCRVILDKESKNLSYQKYTFGNIKHIKTAVKSPINIWVYGEYVLLVLFGASPLVTIKIKSKLLSDGFRNYFELLWKSTEKEY